MNDYEAEKSIKVAEAAMGERDYLKARRFLLKSLKIEPTSKARTLLAECEKLIISSNGSSQSAPRKSSNATKAPPKEETKKQFSEEDTRLCDEILKKTDYYEIIGVPKSAPEDEIKKKYKKLALKLHPDKNRAPQATEAFKKVTQAFACLTDKNKRKVYDEHGTEQNFRQQYHEYFQDEDDFDPDDIFEMFFTGRINPNRRRRYYYRRPQETYAGQNLQPGGNRGLLQYLPMLFLLFALLFIQMRSFGTGQNYSDAFSLERTGRYMIKRTSQNAGVEYYVTKDFYLIHKADESVILEVEQQVEKEYMRVMMNQCRYVMRAREYLNYQLRNTRLDTRERNRLQRELNGLDFTPCQEYDRVRTAT